MNSIVDGRSSARARSDMNIDRALEHADEQRLAVGVVGVDRAWRALRSWPGSARPRRARPRCRRRVRTRAQLPGFGDSSTSLPDARRTRTPPGRSTGPWPCQSDTSASSAARCTRGELDGAGVERPRAQHARAHRPRQRRRAASGRRRPRDVGTAAMASRASRSSLQQRRGAGQRLGHAALQHVLEQRQHLAPQPHALQAPDHRCAGRPRTSRPSAAQAATVVARRTPSRGRT